MSDSKLTIPNAASKAGAFAARPYVTDSYYDLAPDIVRDVLDEAAPLIVAAELRQTAAGLYRRSDSVSMSGDDGRGIERVGIFREIADLLSARADALDGGV